MRLDLNADLGEGIGAEAEVIQLVSSASIACGAHAGDAETIRLSLVRAKANAVRVGAHPGFADPAHFGRRRLVRTPAELTAEIEAQLSLFARLADAAGVTVAYVKLHGALANMAAEDEAVAKTAFRASRAVLGPVAILAMDGTAQVRAAEALGLATIREAYADRAYTDIGLLVPRDQPGALLHDPALVLARAIRLAEGRGLVSITGEVLPSRATSLCVHGDNAAAVALLHALRRGLAEAGIAVSASDQA
jgi:UPF0271 protein